MSEAPGGLSLDQAAAGLYAADLGEFVALRNLLTRQARAAKDRELANQIKVLRRPTVSAWLVNMAARHCADTLSRLLAVADDLREAQLRRDGPAIKHCSGQRAEVERSLLAEIQSWANDHGQSPTQTTMTEVQGTLRAAVGDPRAGRAVSSGRLTRSLQYAGFGEVDLEEALAAPPPRVPPASGPEGTVEVDDAEMNAELNRAQPDDTAESDGPVGRTPRPRLRVVGGAHQRLADPAKPTRVPQSEASDADRTDEDLDALAAAAQAQLEAAQRQLAQVQARKALRTAQDELALAERAARRAADVVTQATVKVERLTEDLQQAQQDLALATEHARTTAEEEQQLRARIAGAKATLNS